VTGVQTCALPISIYAAYANLTISGGSLGNVVGGQIIVDSLTLSGSSIINVNPGTKPVAKHRHLTLVE